MNTEYSAEDIFSLPAIEFTDKQFQTLVEHDFTVTETAYLCYLLSNYDVDSGIIHAKRPVEVAERMGFEASRFYGKRGLIKRLNDLGLVKIAIRHKKIQGKITEPPKKRSKDKKRRCPFRLPIGMIHRQCVFGLLQKSGSKAVWRALMWLSFNCDQKTGEVNVEVRASELAAACGLHRTTMEKAIDWMANDAFGFASLSRDYIICGRLEYTRAR